MKGAVVTNIAGHAVLLFLVVALVARCALRCRISLLVGAYLVATKFSWCVFGSYCDASYSPNMLVNTLYPCVVASTKSIK